jgi:8-oxo-dGTP pyrophosphatase MutT (NUDIX family)
LCQAWARNLNIWVKESGLRAAKRQDMEVLDALKAAVAGFRPRDLPPHRYRRAAVLIPVLAQPGGPHLVLTRRTELVEHHKGQVSFPGGRHEEGDADLLATALREAEEEIGLPPAAVELWGRLDEVEAVVSGFAITPYVGCVVGPVEIRPNPMETDQVILVPMSVFLDPARLRAEQVIRDGLPYEILFYDYPPHVIWGVTARIIHRLVGMLGEQSTPRGPSAQAPPRVEKGVP